MIAEYYIIINELAGSGHGKQVWETIKPILEQRQIHFEYRISEYAGHTIRLAAEYVKTIQRRPNITPVILVVGGDGTLNEALNGISHNKTRFQSPTFQAALEMILHGAWAWPLILKLP